MEEKSERTRDIACQTRDEIENCLKKIAFIGDVFSQDVSGDGVELSDRGSAGFCMILSEIESSLELMMDNVAIIAHLKKVRTSEQKNSGEEITESL